MEGWPRHEGQGGAFDSLDREQEIKSTIYS